jgi:hypothetical protein
MGRVTTIFEEHATSVFRVEANQVWKVAGYIEVVWRKMGDDR